jgi:DNA-binding XRE family transcriptional regulator
VVTVLLPGLRKARKGAGLTQIELAQRALLTPESVCRFEKQRIAASVDAAERLAQVLAVPVEKLIGAARAPQPQPRQPPTERMCADCGAIKPISDFVPIRQTRTGHYGRCRACRARRARERYQSDPQERERQKARVKRNRLRRQQLATAAVQDRTELAHPTRRHRFDAVAPG